jgi:Scramblase
VPASGRSCRRTSSARSGSRLDGPSEEVLGSIDAENWRSWDFAIHDVTGNEVGRITKKWAGILREGFTTADHYGLHISGDVSGRLRTLTVASAAGWTPR